VNEPVSAADGALVVPLSSLRAVDLPSAGGKGANLGELVAAGFPVPPGFVVTTASYASVAGGLDAMVDGHDAMLDGHGVAEAGASIRSTISRLPVPPDVARAIAQAYRELGEGFVAVRSSATAEDLPGAAFAGQQDTFLHVVGVDGVIGAVRDCWASLWTDRAILYRSRLGIVDADVQIAVVVQQMVESEYAGVLFTANPVTGARTETVIDASPGLGEAVVSGLVTPDHYVVDERGRVTERGLGKREVVISGRATGGVEHDESGATTARRLGDETLVELASLGRRIQQHFERPQDIEWAYAGGTTWIVQSRPLTALPPPPLKLNRLRRTIGAILSELLPIRPYPLDMSTWTVQGHGRILTRMFREIPAVTIRMTDLLPEVDGVVDQIIPADPHPTLRTFATPFRMRDRVRRFRPALWTSDPRFALFEERIQALRAADPAQLEWPQLLRIAREALEALDGFIDLRIDYLPRVGVDLLRFRVLLALLGLGRFASALLLGGDTKTQQANRELRGIADAIAANPEWRHAFATAATAEVADRMLHDREFERLRPAIDAFLEEYGHRETTSAFLMSEPTWSERPEILVGALQSLVRGETVHEGPPEDVSVHRMVGLRRVRLARAGHGISAAAAAARAGIGFREDSHFHAMRPVPPLRAALLEAGRRLHLAGMLDSPESVLHLRLEELDLIDDPNSIDDGVATMLRHAVRTRSARRAELAGAPLISPASLYRGRKNHSGALVAGTPAGGGTATGAVRIIRGPDDFGSLQQGEVLVCQYTNPSWTPLFQAAAAVVVDSGGIASHAAIVAREYGIPAVMATGNGTRVLTDGQLVTVNGDSGYVRAAE
jgi:phosphohistidine swiveling domain-containing protein